MPSYSASQPATTEQVCLCTPLLTHQAPSLLPTQGHHTCNVPLSSLYYHFLLSSVSCPPAYKQTVIYPTFDKIKIKDLLLTLTSTSDYHPSIFFPLGHNWQKELFPLFPISPVIYCFETTPTELSHPLGSTKTAAPEAINSHTSKPSCLPRPSVASASSPPSLCLPTPCFPPSPWVSSSISYPGVSLPPRSLNSDEIPG